ncbi:MAG TPA: SDR family NAD(P)-dependent oxidoreductase [bacterium]|nr:SDR family NAD(P)-dependent oxidoreductase [bacterium]HPT30052.1 SDR family NAD(P)-dependent oxidoreductase [bacterium]
MAEPIKAIIIGASSGIGQALAELMAKKNYRVGSVARNEANLRASQAKCPQNILIKPVDVNDPEAAIASVNYLIAEMGGLDILIISAGIGFQNKDLELEKELKTIQTNVIGFTALANLAFKHFVTKKSGHLVGITSIMGIRGEQGAPAYSATKGYQSNYLESLRQRACRLKLPITVTEIQPGFMQSQMAKGDNIFWSAPLKKAAAQILRAIEKKKDHAYVTKRWTIIAWLLKIFPRGWYKKLRFAKNND